MKMDDDFDERSEGIKAEDFKRLFKKVSQQGDVSTQKALAVMYEKGLVVSQDQNEAIKWWWAAAAAGDNTAQYHLGLIYENGLRTADFKDAALWYRLSAEQGNVKAQYHLGLMYELGWGMKKDHKQAVEQYSRAADQGNYVAEVNLAEIYAKGQEGTSQNLVQALMWYLVAKEHIRDSDHLLRDFIEKNKNVTTKKMTPDQIAEAKKLAKEWMEKNK